MVLHEKDVDFETYEVDLQDKSEEFLQVSPTGKVPVIKVDEGAALYESNVVNEYLEEVTGEPRLLPEDPKERAFARIWAASADSNFYPAVFVSSVGRERDFTEEQISDALQRLETNLSQLEARLSDRREYLAGEYSLADIAHAGVFGRLRGLADSEAGGEVSLADYPNVSAWMERIENRPSYKAAG